MSDVLSSLSTDSSTSIIIEGLFDESGHCYCDQNGCETCLHSEPRTEIAQGEHISFYSLCVCWLIVILSRQTTVDIIRTHMY
jgi:hypothetical protein